MSIVRPGSRMFRRAGQVAAALAGLALLATPARAQQTYPPEVEEQCQDDYFRFCSSYALGTNELRSCMQAKARNLSPNCKQALKDAGFVRASSNKNDE